MDNPGYVVYTDEIELKEQSRTDSNPKISTQQPQTDTSKFSSSTSNQNDSQAAAASNESSATSSSAVCNDCGESTGPVRKREPRLIYCRDGVITEDEVGKLFDEFDEPLSKTVSRWTEGMVPSEERWPKWFAFYSVFLFVHVIIACEFLGEKLANFFGIMDSKYTYILDDHLRTIQQRKEIEKSLEMEPEITLTNVRKIDSNEVQNDQ